MHRAEGDRNSAAAAASSSRMARPTVLLPALLAAAIVLLLTTLPSASARAAASPSLSIGIADQKVDMFADPRLKNALHVRKVRRVVPWDAMNVDFERAETDDWMGAAKAAGERVLVSFGHSRVEARRRVAPTPAQYVAAFQKFRARYPQVSEFAVWNEPNLCGEPLCHKPELAARYYDALTKACPSCTILASEVLDNAGMASWVKAFLKRVKTTPRIWGLHNYLDANRLRTSGTKRLLQLVKGQIWFTETGGIVHRSTTNKEGGFPETVAHAGIAVRWIFDRLVTLSPRITRVYLYHWDPGGPGDSWDSALLNLDGTPRPAYRVVLNRVDAMQRRRQAPSARRR